MLPLIVSALLAQSSLSSNTVPDDWWVAPGWTISSLVTIDPAEYAAPILYDAYYADAFIVTSGDEEVWRVVIVGDDKVVALQEDWPSPREYILPSLTRRVASSPNGCFIAVQSLKEGAERTVASDYIYHGDTAVLIDIDNWTAETFDPAPGGASAGLLVSGSGRVIGVTDSNQDQLPGFNVYDRKNLSAAPEFVEVEHSFRYFDVASEKDIFVAGLPGYGFPAMGAFDWDGNLLWVFRIEEGDFPTVIRITPDGNTVFLSTRNRSIYKLDGRTGGILDSAEYSWPSNSMVTAISNGSSSYACADTDNNNTSFFTLGSIASSFDERRAFSNSELTTSWLEAMSIAMDDLYYWILGVSDDNWLIGSFSERAESKAIAVVSPAMTPVLSIPVVGREGRTHGFNHSLTYHSPNNWVLPRSDGSALAFFTESYKLNIVELRREGME